MILVGLTGNIGMGKSTVLGIFGELGAATIDADKVVAELLKMKPILDIIRPILGDFAFTPTGELDKSAVAEIIFNDEPVRKAYEDALHPFVFERIDDMLRGQSAQVAVVEVPLLFERGHGVRFHKTVTVYTDEYAALDRLALSGAMERADVARRLTCQMPISEKIRLSNYAIDNNDGIDRTRIQTRQVFRAILASA